MTEDATAKPLAEPAPWFARHAEAIVGACREAPAVDIGCGRGRHSLALAARGVTAVGLDRNATALAEFARRAQTLPAHPVRVDLGPETRLPLRTGSCGAVLVFRFLERALVGELVRVLRPGGLLLYETFTVDQRKLGYGPRNPAFLLEPGELPQLFPTLEVLAAEEGVFDQPRPQAASRLLARRSVS